MEEERCLRPLVCLLLASLIEAARFTLALVVAGGAIVGLGFVCKDPGAAMSLLREVRTRGGKACRTVQAFFCGLALRAQSRAPGQRTALAVPDEPLDVPAPGTEVLHDESPARIALAGGKTSSTPSDRSKTSSTRPGRSSSRSSSSPTNARVFVLLYRKHFYSLSRTHRQVSSLPRESHDRQSQRRLLKNEVLNVCPTLPMLVLTGSQVGCLVFWLAVCGKHGPDGGLGALLGYVVAFAQHRLVGDGDDIGEGTWSGNNAGSTVIVVVSLFRFSSLLYACWSIALARGCNASPRDGKQPEVDHAISLRGWWMHQLTRIEMLLVLFVECKVGMDDSTPAHSINTRSAILLIVAAIFALPDLIEKMFWPALYTLRLILSTVDVSFLVPALFGPDTVALLLGARMQAYSGMFEFFFGQTLRQEQCAESAAQKCTRLQEGTSISSEHYNMREYAP